MEWTHPCPLCSVNHLACANGLAGTLPNVMSRGLTIARYIICLNHQNITKMCRTARSRIVQIDLIQSMLGDGQICMELPECEVHLGCSILKILRLPTKILQISEHPKPGLGAFLKHSIKSTVLSFNMLMISSHVKSLVCQQIMVEMAEHLGNSIFHYFSHQV
jgi:hypothetical protein